MINFINGWKQSKLRVKNGAVLIDTIILPITEGLIESTEELKTEHELLNYEVVKDVHGYRLSWRLPYSQYANKQTMLMIQQLLRYSKAGYQIYLMPRIDCPWRNFEVIYNNDSLDYGIKRGGINAVGNNALEIKFVTKNLINDTGWIDPDSIIYSGFYLHNRLAVLAV